VELRRSASSPNLDRSQADEVASPSLETNLKVAEDGDAVALLALRQTGAYLGIGIPTSSTCSIPAWSLFGGSLGLTHELSLPAAREFVEQRAMAELSRTTRIVVSSFRQDACVIGGLALSCMTFSASRGWFPHARTFQKPVRSGPRPESALRVNP
jgi:predicted NBD/HSP70 family sugar kinase